MPLLLLFGIFDIMVGVAGITASLIPLQGNSFIFTIGLLGIIKGIYSILAGVLSGFYFDLLGLLDLVLGIFLLLAFYNLMFGWVIYLGILMVIKGLYSVVIFLVS